VLISRGRIVADGTGSEIKALAAGRTVRATLEDADHQALSQLGGVESVEVRGETVLVHAKDTDAVARYLLTETDARDLEITARGIEDAFLTLTGGAADDPADHRDTDPSAAAQTSTQGAAR
jgi:ABC-2 type transport system ATP-binding protein